MDEQRYLREQLVLLQKEYEKAAKPIVDRLIHLASMEPPRLVIPLEAWEKLQKDLEK